MTTPEKTCTRCKGTGFFRERGALDQKECICTLIKVIGLKLGPELATAPDIGKSPLFVANEPGEEPLVDRTRSNLFLKGWWSDLTPHLKWSLVCKMGTVNPRNYFFHIVTDERLKSVWLDKEAYTAKSKKKREDIPTFNTLADLIGGSYNLAIIRLGFLGYRNVAMPGILKEALMIRQALRLPTWLVEEPDSPFGPGHFSFNPEVGEYLDAQKYEVLNFVKDRGANFELRGVEGANTTPSDEGLAVDEEPEKVDKPVRFRPTAPVSHMQAEVGSFDPSHDPRVSGSGSKKSNYGRKKPSGGGPV